MQTPRNTYASRAFRIESSASFQSRSSFAAAMLLRTIAIVRPLGHRRGRRTTYQIHTFVNRCVELPHPCPPCRCPQVRACRVSVHCATMLENLIAFTDANIVLENSCACGLPPMPKTDTSHFSRVGAHHTRFRHRHVHRAGQYRRRQVLGQARREVDSARQLVAERHHSPGLHEERDHHHREQVV